MHLTIARTKQELGQQAAAHGAAALRQAIQTKGHASIIVATGASQFEMLAALVALPGVDWATVTGFHLDEYIGLPMTHPASFRRYLKERFVSQVPLRAFHYLSGEGDAAAECRRVGALLREHPIDVAFVGIGENGHLAFNDPPADFVTEEPYLIVNLDDACRRQQLGEGWFPDFDAVPKQAISMSCRQIMKSKLIVVSVPDARKAKAVQATVEGPIGPQTPAIILRQHPATTLFLDPDSAALLKGGAVRG